MKSLKILKQVLKRFMSIGDEGAIMAVVLIFVAILLLAGATATILLTTDTQIGSNYKSSQQALYAAEAGAQEARERLRLKPSTDPGYPDIINDDDPDNTEWTYYIGTEEEAQEKGYDSANDAHERTSSLQTDMDYTVVITHQTDPSSGEVLYRGDVDGDGDFDRHTDETRGDPNIYLITGYGDAGGASKVVQMEVTRFPPITVKAAIYTGGSSLDLKGTAYISGNNNDACCGTADDLPGVYTKASTTVSPVGTVTITGEGMDPENPAEPSVSRDDDDVDDINIPGMIDGMKTSADFSYTLNADTTHTDTAIPGPGDGWGTPTIVMDDIYTCDECNLICYNMNGHTIRLSGGVTGCGILLVEGNLDISGDFSWYGPIIVSGSFTYKGGGTGNITGAVLSGGSAETEDTMAGNIKINYCHDAVENFENHSLPILSWKQELAEE